MKERQWQLRETAILDAAVELLQTKGFNAMTLEDISESIGISRPTLYQHFKSKEDVVTHVIIRNLDAMNQLLACLDPALSPGDRLRQFIHLAVDARFAGDHVPLYDLTRIKYTYAAQDPEFIDTECACMNGFTDLVREAQSSGEVSNDVRAELHVLAVTAIFKNLEVDKLIDEGKATIPEIEAMALHILFRS